MIPFCVTLYNRFVVFCYTQLDFKGMVTGVSAGSVKADIPPHASGKITNGVIYFHCSAVSHTPPADGVKHQVRHMAR